MSPYSWPVVLGTLAVGSPALWAAQVSGTLSPDVALMRLLVCLGAVWVALSIVAMLAERTVAANDRARQADETAALPQGADMQRPAGVEPSEGPAPADVVPDRLRVG